MDAEVYVYDDKIKPIDKVEFSIFPNEEKKRISAVKEDPNGIDIPELYDNVEPKRGGLIDPRLGSSGPDTDCATCGLNSSKCVGHFGHITLAEPIFHYGYLQIIKRVLSCICLRCSKLLVYKNENEIAEMLKNKSGKNLLNEVKNLTKNITHCQKANYGCGTPVSKIKIEINKAYVQILLVAEIAMAPGTMENTTEEEGYDSSKRRLRQILSPSKIHSILSGISDNDCRIMGIDPKKSRPENMVQYIFPVPPVQVRPSVKADFMSASTLEDDLTHVLANIIKSNVRIRKYKESINESDAISKYGPDQIQLLQYHAATYFDNESLALPKSEQKSKQIKSLSSRLKSKEGRIRSNLMGKRVDFSARSVITPDPSLDINELGVPLAIAKNITFPEIVTPQNIEKLQKLVKRGRNRYPGANFVFPVSNYKKGKRFLPIDLRYREGGVELRYGDIVERHIVTGDYVLLNRQPTLHKLSMMGHKAKILNVPNLNTLRLNVAAVTPYNADFDGDEMNIFAPQSIQTAIELEKMADVKRQIISPASSVPIIGVIQDSLLGSYNMTQSNTRIDWKDIMNILSYTTFDNFKNFKKDKKEYRGTELFSMIIPKKISTSRKNFILKRGELDKEKGLMNKSMLGSKKPNSLIHLIWDEYGIDPTRNFIDNVQRMVNNYNLLNGFTCGIGDVDVNNELLKKLNIMFETKKLEVNHLITEIENNPDLMDEDLFELSVFSELNAISEEVSKLIIDNMDRDNNFYIMAIGSGSKGSPSNIGQMGGCIGQTAVEGKRLKKKLNGRTLPYFHQNDDSAEAKGFINSSFIRGMKPTEFIIHNMGAREGLIDTAIRTAESGYIQRKLIKTMEDISIKYDGTVRNSNDTILQFTYGDSGIDTTKQYKHVFDSMMMNDEEFDNMYKFTKEELKKVSINEEDNNRYISQLKEMRNQMRISQIKITLNYKVFNAEYMLPVNFTKIIENTLYDNSESKEKLSPKYIMSKLEDIIEYKNTMLTCISKNNQKDDNNIKLKDEKVSKTAFRYALHNYLSPKRILFEYKFNKKQFDLIVSQIINSFNKSVVHAGQMVGILAAQSIGEPVTQLTLNSLDWEEEIIIHDSKSKILKIGEFIDNIIEENPKLTTLLKDTCDEMDNTHYVDITKMNIHCPSVNTKGKIEWKKVTALTKHLPVNKDGTNTLLKITTESGRTVSATKAKSFLTRKNNKLVATRGDELNIGMYIPLSRNIPGFKNLKYLDTTFYNSNFDSKYMLLDFTSGVFFGSYLLNGFITDNNITIIENNKKIVNIINKFCNRYNIKYYINSNNTIINSKDITIFIKNIFNMNNKNIPDFIFDADKEFIRGFLFGYFNSDNITINNSEIVIKYKSKNILEKISLLLMKFGIITKFINDNILKISSTYINLLIKEEIIYTNIDFEENNIRNDTPDIIPNITLSMGTISESRYNLIHNINSKYNKDNEIIKEALNSDVYYDKIIQIDEIKPTHRYVYDLTVEDNKTFLKKNGILNYDTFHSAGIGSKGTASLGVGRVRELLSFSKNMKTPMMEIYLDEKHKNSKDMANKIASHIKYTDISHIRKRIDVYYDPIPYKKDGFMNNDGVYNIFHSHNPGKYSCQSEINNLPWLLRIELDREKMMEKEVTLLDIKSKFCSFWEKRFHSVKTLKKDEKKIIEKIQQLAILSNSDNDKDPIIHIRFDMNNFNFMTIVKFSNIIIDSFKLKGMENIDDILDVKKERVIVIDKKNNNLNKEEEYVIYTKGINLLDIRYINGIDLKRTICNDIISIYEEFGIEAARAALLKEIKLIIKNTNYQHLSILMDVMTSNGNLVSVDRHGLNKVDTNPFARASFEKTIEQFINAAVFCETDTMKSVSSRVMAGLVINGGTGAIDLKMDTEMLEKSEYIEETKQYHKDDTSEITLDPVIKDTIERDIDEKEDIFMPI